MESSDKLRERPSGRSGCGETCAWNWVLYRREWGLSTRNYGDNFCEMVSKVEGSFRASSSKMMPPIGNWNL